MINRARVNELKEDLGSEDITEIVELFLDEVEAIIGDLRLGNVGRNLQEDMHFLKGSALNLGFDTLGSLCSTSEKLAAKGRFAEVPVRQILIAYDASKSEFFDQTTAW